VVREVKVTSLRSDSQIANRTSKVAFLDVKACLKFFRAIFRANFAWSFSMLLEVRFLSVPSPDDRVLFLCGVDGGVFFG
jgi:hypothetical protein